MKIFLTSIRDLFTRTYDFRGVSSRADFWYAMLFYLIYTISIIYINEYYRHYYFDWALLYFIFYTAIPYLSLVVRRIRNIDKFNWEVLLTIVGCVPYLFGFLYFASWYL